METSFEYLIAASGEISPECRLLIIKLLIQYDAFDTVKHLVNTYKKADARELIAQIQEIETLSSELSQQIDDGYRRYGVFPSIETITHFNTRLDKSLDNDQDHDHTHSLDG